VLLAATRFSAGDAKGLQRCVDNMKHVLEKTPASLRLQRFANVITVFSLMLKRQEAAAMTRVEDLARDIPEPDFDFEAACNLVAVLAQLATAALPLTAVDGWIDTLGLRFCTTRSMAEILARAGQAHPPFADRIRKQHGVITALAEQAVSHSVAGEPRVAARSLLAAGGRTMNAKLIDMARMVLERHADRIADAQDLMGMADELKRRYATGPLVGPLGTDGGRQSGGLVLRSRDEAAAVQPGIGAARPAAPGSAA
jgi:hypothetical protein